MKKEILWLGIDVGSTTVKTVALLPESRTILYQDYKRHFACQAETVLGMLREIQANFPGYDLRAAVCGSGGRNLASRIGAFYIQEVVANSLAIKELYPQTRSAIELGGQDAKIIFFHFDEHSRQLIASDMRMNGSCAGGTGAFIDEVANLLRIKPEEFEAKANAGSHIYNISGRCGVFAKTDIQPLLNQGISREDIALSTFHAIARQTIGGLAQGLEIKPPVIFEGGPLTFNPSLVNVFMERLGLEPDDVVRPDRPELLIAYGTALSIDAMFKDQPNTFDMTKALAILENYNDQGPQASEEPAERFFASSEEQQQFRSSRKLPDPPSLENWKNSTQNVFLGIDAGSTTTKFVLINEEGTLLGSRYFHNDGEPLAVFRKALSSFADESDRLGLQLNIRGVGTTGYGEILFWKAFTADYHTVETVAHAEAALAVEPAASFILDIGGQDMKAISITNEIITGIVLNEACSAGCGSFLENFAKSLGIQAKDIADLAFSSDSPSILGSRCTVFMNSSIITEQKNGKTTADILAGLCRSIIENVFTKVIRVSNLARLGNTIVVQGGTFKNDAVLRALEQYTQKEVIRAPYPGEMGALGIALLTRKHVQEKEAKTGARHTSSFIGLDAIRSFTYQKQSNVPCNLCANLCNRTVIRFPNNTYYVTGNRCERGEFIEGISDDTAQDNAAAATGAAEATATAKTSAQQPGTAPASKRPPRRELAPDLMRVREELLFREFEVPRLCADRELRIGIPRVLEFWNSFPFWKAFFRSLGFTVVPSARSTRKIYEKGIQDISSDTVCYPAKLAHGHMYDLAEKKVDRIFMPMMVRMPSENPSLTSDHVCAVVKGYPMVLRTGTDPARNFGIPFDIPLFHWFNKSARDLQIRDYMRDTFGISQALVKKAIAAAELAQRNFRQDLEIKGLEQLNHLAAGGENFGVVIAGRPYHNDFLINHDLSRYFTRLGIPVLTIDALPELDEEDLRNSRFETTNNFHVRMISAAMTVARNPNLELVQIVSFGCGHDAIITDEISRIMRAMADKEPLVLKLDESDVAGPMNIRIKSFVETIRARRKKGINRLPIELPDPYPVKFNKKHRKERIILVPNVSESFCKLTTAAIRNEGYRVEPMPLGGRDAVRLGKKFVHNDICFPAQMNIGEFLATMERGLFPPEQVVLGLAKYQCDCRLAHYASLARKALDEAGYPDVPIITTDKDTKGMHPEFSLSTTFQLRMMWALTMMDALDYLSRIIRPYELQPGQTDDVYTRAIDNIAVGIERGVPQALKAFTAAIEELKTVQYDRSKPRPKVFVIGEFLLNYHPGSNFYIERYLEENGMELILPTFIDVLRKDYLRIKHERKRFHVKYSFLESLTNDVADALMDNCLDQVGKIAKRHPLYHVKDTLATISEGSSHIIDPTFTSGEGWMIAGEILHYARQGVESFVILQPFGCLPNHVIGRGLVKRIKEDFPAIQILALDYDPDTSFANIENRLQMLIINAKERVKGRKKAESARES